MLSNGLEAKVGTLGSKYEFFHEWKRLKESDAGSVELETMLRGICEKKTFLDLLENFILYDHSGGHTTKILARNHQYLGVNEAVSAYEKTAGWVCSGTRRGLARATPWSFWRRRSGASLQARPPLWY